MFRVTARAWGTILLVILVGGLLQRIFYFEWWDAVLVPWGILWASFVVTAIYLAVKAQWGFRRGLGVVLTGCVPVLVPILVWPLRDSGYWWLDSFLRLSCAGLPFFIERTATAWVRHANEQDYLAAEARREVDRVYDEWLATLTPEQRNMHEQEIRVEMAESRARAALREAQRARAMAMMAGVMAINAQNQHHHHRHHPH